MEIIHIILTMHVILLNHASQSFHIIKKRHVDRACESSPGKFSCDNGYCINGNYKCDGSSDCPDGSDENHIACRCGLSSVPNIRDRGRAMEVRYTEHYPWHVSIHFINSSRQEILLCSGALINMKYVLTAASCLYDEANKTLFPHSSLKVSLGKLLKNFKSKEKTHRIHEVENITNATFQRYYYRGNLALIQLKQVVDLSNTSPICLLPTDRFPLKSRELTFTGWDLHFDKKASQENARLLQVKLEYLNNTQCKRKFNSSVIIQYLQFDKGCLIPEKGIAVSPYDIGGPVILKQGNRQYLFGIISNLIPEVHSLIVMTEVAKRIEWINESMTANSRPKASCESDYFECMGKCISEKRWCDGNFDCPDNSDEMYCENANRISPVCGRLNVDEPELQTLIGDGKIAREGKIPWYVALYWKMNSTIESATFKCGGTLISSNMVLTAAHCVHSVSAEVEELVDPSRIILSAAIYRVDLSYKSDYQQIREAKEILKKSLYLGKDNKYLQDIAIVVLSNDLILTSFIMPACLRFDEVVPNDGDIGYLAGLGYPAEGANEISPFLKETNLTYLSYLKCKIVLRGYSFSDYVLNDKFCTTKVEKNPGFPLQGDSGGGLTFAYNGLHYVMGIVSIGSTKFPEISVFTNVSKYKKWIKNQLTAEFELT